MLNISNMFLVECWRLETSSSLFYDFFKMTIQQDLSIFNGWHLPFLNVSYSPVQKNAILESWNNWLLSNWGRFLNGKGPGTYHQSSKMFKILLKNIGLDDNISMIFFQFFKLLIFWVVSGVKGQRMIQNDKTFCLPHFIS